MTVIRYRLLNGRPYVVTQPSGGGGGTTYATTFSVTLSSSSGTVGAGQTVTVTPVGGSWPVGQSVALHVTGPTYAASPDSRTGSGTTPVTFSFTPSAAGSFTVDAIAAGMTSTGAVAFTASSAAPMAQAFTVTNWGGSASLGVYKRGVWFAKGDVPSGSVPVLSGGTAQFYAVSRWSDGSMKRARMWVRDTNLAAGASRSYTITATSGTLSGAAKAIGNAGLISALSGHDFKITFSNLKDYAGSAYGGGSLTASLATHAAIGTRWEVLSTGPVADVWQGWGMAGSDPHIKINWYLTRLKNADGSTLAWRPGVVISLDQWSTAGKTDLTYDAVLADGATAIVSFTGVQHYYHSQWIMCVNDGSLNAGAVPWVGATLPTLHYSYDKAAAVATNLVPPYRTTKTPIVAPQYAYVPCNSVADVNLTDHPDSHRTAIDAVGLYQGRGAITRFDVDHFMAQTPQAFAVMLTNALTGLGVSYHYRSSRTRTRPGESADVANTNIVLLMAPKATSTSDFTAQGLPIAVNAYRGGGGTDGWVTPNRLSSNPWGEGSLDASHAVSYCYYAGLITGDEWFIEAQLDLALNLAHQGIFGYHQQVPPFSLTYNAATPSAVWTGLLGQWQQQNLRYVGWSQLVQGHGFSGLPDDHQYKPAATALASHQGDYIGTVLDYLPADFAAGGIYFPGDANRSLFSPWMGGFGSIGAYAHYLCNEDARWKRLGGHISNWSVNQALAGRWYMWDTYRTAYLRQYAAWDATTNPVITAVQQPYLELGPNLDASGVFTQTTGAQFNVIGSAPPPLRNGDKQTITVLNDGGNAANGIPGVAEGTIGYVVNLNPGSQLTGRNSPATPPSWQLSATPGGSPMTFGGQVVTNVNIAECPQSVTEYPVATAGADYLSWPYIPDWGNYVPIHLAVIMMARQAGNTLVTSAVRDGALAFVANMDSNSSYYSGFDMAAVV